LTHDLDFSAILAATDADAPSVIQVRTPNSRPEGMQSVLIATLRQYQDELLAGALIVVEPARSRVRRLPIRRKESQ
jgi:predicted nuclease of predicted toxin-antitoxin system